jgi:hypothetical protein
LLLACTRLDLAALPWRPAPLLVEAPLALEFETLLATLDREHRIADPASAVVT